MDYLVGIDIGGTTVKYGLLDEKGKILHDHKIKTSNNGSTIIDNIETIVHKYQADYNIIAVGISVPGVIQNDGYMVTGGAIFDFYGINLKKILEEKLQLPVYIENDANCAALAEKWQGSGQEYQNILTIVVGTGIGGGIIINNQLFRGAHATAGEFGFMIVEPIKNDDTRMATLSLTGSVQCGIVNKYEEKSLLARNSLLSGEDIYKLSEQDDLIAEQVIDTFYNRLTNGIFNVAVTFDPDVILIGGAISSNQSFIEELKKRLNILKEGHRDMKNMTFSKLLPCYFQNKAGIIGAVYKAIMENEKEDNIGY